MKAFLVVLAGTLVTVLATHDPYHDVQPELPTIVSSKDNKIFVGGINPKENTTKYWHDLNIATIREKLAQKPKKNLAKNLILFLGDGMSLATLAAARMYLGQLKKEAGENSFLSFEKFPYTGFAKTYCADSQVADSACSATAYLTGAKGNIYTVGVTSSVGLMDWRNMKNESHHPSSLLKWAQDAGKGTGIISTCRITDASPAATYAHSAYRLWQTDHEMKRDIKNVELGDDNFSIDEAMKGLKDISLQMIENSPGNGFKVILGGGWDTFLPNTTNDEPKKTGARLDNRNLIQEWKTSKENIHKSASYVTNKAELLKLDIDSTDYVLGLFQPGNMQYHKLANKDEQPTLAQMTEFAIKMMKKEANGFVLFIEGGTIDVSHHENKAHLALDETVELHNAVEMAVNMTNENETLIVVTADHAHTMNINGYPKRGADIFNYVQGTADKLPYSTLSYANGPNDPRYNEHKNAMRNITTDKRDDPQYTFQTINLLPSETHDGQDVTVFARGPWAHLLVGNFEQTVIPYAMAYAAQIGPAKETNKKSQKES
ncbi:alkaline phosphatase-like [Homalodisca vitripennis]|uniref:alkaline phosphatase-like n=1 Tax=Homalodisca vitripennis TaxID=197043 RepID=UPI001EECEE20|nr:alkaline phosphatase-like [Homalodisca vitripennis]KAG8249485.1 hypothetical protein J6590_017466 [Homalodisca vitripennis]